MEKSKREWVSRSRKYDHIYISKVFWKTASEKGKHMYITSLLNLGGGKRKLENENSHTIVYVSLLYSMVK